jgi:hypothetical protein
MLKIWGGGGGTARAIKRTDYDFFQVAVFIRRHITLFKLIVTEALKLVAGIVCWRGSKCIVVLIDSSQLGGFKWFEQRMHRGSCCIKDSNCFKCSVLCY